MKYPYHTLYHLKHFQVYSSAVLSTFTLLSNQSPGRLFFLPNWNSTPRYTTSPCPLPQALVTSNLLSDGTTLTPLWTPCQWTWTRSPGFGVWLTSPGTTSLGVIRVAAGVTVPFLLKAELSSTVRTTFCASVHLSALLPLFCKSRCCRHRCADISWLSQSSALSHLRAHSPEWTLRPTGSEGAARAREAGLAPPGARGQAVDLVGCPQPERGAGMAPTCWESNNGLARGQEPNPALSKLNTVAVNPGFPGGSDGKESACSAGDPGSIPGLGRSPGEGNGNPLQYPCLENPMDGGAWQAAVHGVTKSQTGVSD